MTIEFFSPSSLEITSLFLQGLTHQPPVQYASERGARNDLVESIRRRSGPHVAISGDTWVSSFVGMNALRPFQPSEIDRIGGVAAYLPHIWQMGTVPGDARHWSIPFQMGSRYIYYHQETLKQAGIDGEGAFTSSAQMEDTLARLKRAGITYPLALQAASPLEILFNATAWIREAGGRFISADRQSVILDSAEAKAGLSNFCRLMRYVNPDLTINPDEPFIAGEAAVGLSGLWMSLFCQRNLPGARYRQVRMAVQPGEPFIGGGQLVIMEYTTQVEEALYLIQHLSSQAVGQRMMASGHYLDMMARLSVTQKPPYVTTDNFPIVQETFRRGRPFWAWPLGSLLEERISKMLVRLIKKVLESPEQDIPTLVSQYVDPLVVSLNRLIHPER